jgi:hypothetical protein
MRLCDTRLRDADPVHLSFSKLGVHTGSDAVELPWSFVGNRRRRMSA